MATTVRSPCLRILKRAIAALLLTAHGLVGAPSSARTITVSRDGGADYAVIQDALEVAATGDSVLIAEGEYPELHPLEDGFAIAMRPPVSNVTLVGAGAALTLIGPATLTSYTDGRLTAGLGILPGISGTSVAGVTIRNVYDLASLNAAAIFTDCRFEEPGHSAIALVGTDGTQLNRCRITGSQPSARGITSFVGEKNPRTTVVDCEFEGPMGSGIILDGGDFGRIEGSRFRGMRVGITAYRGQHIEIRNCEFNDVENYGVAFSHQSEVTMTDCRFGINAYANLYLSDGTVLVGSRNVFGGSPDRSLWFAGGVDVMLDHNSILNGGGLSVLVESPTQYTPRLDLRSNYWGTTDLLQIAAWISDGNDPPPPNFWYCPAAVVEHLPILNSPVPIGESSFGGLKARFGDAHE